MDNSRAIVRVFDREIAGARVAFRSRIGLEFDKASFNLNGILRWVWAIVVRLVGTDTILASERM